MITFTHVAIIIVLFIILLMMLSKTPLCSAEHFDSYYNHDMGAHTVYQNQPGANQKITIDESALRSQYRWSDKTPGGYNVYDKYYEAIVNEKNADYNPNIDYSERSEEPYDAKFNSVPAGQGYEISDMAQNMLHREFHHSGLPGFGVDLAQKGWH